MALVNPNIAMSYKPTTEYQPENALANYAKIQQIQSGQLELQEYKRKRDTLDKIQQAMVAAGGPSDVRAGANEMLKYPEYVTQGRAILQELDDTAQLEQYIARQSGGKPSASPVAPNALVAPAVPAVPAAPAMTGELGSGTFDIMSNRPAAGGTPRGYATPVNENQRRLIEMVGQSTPGTPRGYATPTNGLAPTAAPAPITNALALTTAPMDQVTQLENDIAMLSGNRNPRAIALVNSLEKRLQKLQPFAVGPNLYDPITKTFIQGPKQSKLLTPEELAQELQISQAKRATGPVINVSTEKKFGEAFGSKMAESDINKLTTAEKAPAQAENANRIIDIVNKGNLFTGPAADIKLNIARALNVVGANNSEKIANTEVLIAGIGQSTIDAIKTAGLGAGQGFTNKDLDFLQGVAGGTINLTPQTLTRLATLQHRAATYAAESWNKRVKQMPRSAVEGTGLSIEPIIVPPLSSNKRAAPITSGNVVVTPDGQSHSFPTPEAAAQFKKAAGL